MTWLLLVIAAVAGLLLWRVLTADKAALPRRGDLLPEFSLPDQNGRQRASSEFRGRWLVLYFYLRDDTPG